MIKFLVEAGANVTVVDRDGCTPLHYLCEAEHYEMVRYLLPLAKNCKDVRNRYGKRPADMAPSQEVRRIIRNFSEHRKSQPRMTSNERREIDQFDRGSKSPVNRRLTSNTAQNTSLSGGKAGGHIYIHSVNNSAGLKQMFSRLNTSNKRPSEGGVTPILQERKPSSTFGVAKPSMSKTQSS